MKHLLWLILACCTVSAQAEHLGVYQHGTVVRMRTGDCAVVHHGFMLAMGGPQPAVEETCPEYTLISEKVVFVIVGKSSNDIIPLADEINFRFHNHELAIRLDDAAHESKFTIKEMLLRSQWDIVQRHIQEEMNNSSVLSDGTLAMKARE